MPYRKSENPDVLYGRDFEGETMEIHEIAGEIGEVVIRGKDDPGGESGNSGAETRLMIFDLTDFTDSITVKMFLREGQEEDADCGYQAKETSYKIKGITTIDKFDGELTIGSIVGIKKSEDFTSKRVDNSPGEACGAPLSYEDERYGRRFRGEETSSSGRRSGECRPWRSRTTAVSRPSRTPTMPWTKGILSRSSMVWRDIWWTT